MKTNTIFQAAIVKPCCILIIGAILLCSCTHLYYSPNSSNVPLFQKKGEIRLSGNYCVGNSAIDEITGGEIQASFAAGNHLGILLNTAFMGAQGNNTSQHSSGSGSIIEIGAGYFKPVKKNHVFETYAGLGFGNVKNHYSSGGNSEVNFTKFFLQPSIGYSRKYFNAGIASKLSLVGMRVSLPNVRNSIEPYEMEAIEYITARPLSVLWEPSFFISAGVKAVKAQFQFTPSLNLNNKELAQNETLFSMGISIAIDPAHVGK